MGGLTREPQGPSTGLRMSGRVVLTPLGLSAAMREERRPSTGLGTNGKTKPKPLSKRALTAQLKGQKREAAVIARQKPVLNLREYVSFLRTGYPSASYALLCRHAPGMACSKAPPPRSGAE